MDQDNQVGIFYRITSQIAWAVFWTVIGGLCVLLKIYFHFFRKSESDLGVNSKWPIRIGFCENGAGYGGAIISLATFLEKLPEHYDAVIYTSIATEPYVKLSRFGMWRHMRTVRLINKGKLDAKRIPFSSTLDNLLNLLPYALRYYCAFKRDKIQCVYLNNDASCNFAAAIAAKFAGIPLILHARGFNDDTRGNRWVLSRVDHCIAVSSAVRDDLFRLGVAHDQCTIVPEGLDLTVFHPKPPSSTIRRELDLTPEQQIITLVGGLVDWKGQDVLLDAAPLVLKKHPSAVFLLVGAAYGRDNGYADMIAKRATEGELASHVFLLGMREDVADILSCSDVVVHASTKPEPFGRTFLEGMALGKAVIASNEGGPIDVITHHVDGLLIEPRNSVRLAEAIDELLSEVELKDRLGESAAVTALAYSIENHADSISLVLRNLLRGKFNSHGIFAGISDGFDAKTKGETLVAEAAEPEIISTK